MICLSFLLDSRNSGRAWSRRRGVWEADKKVGNSVEVSSLFFIKETIWSLSTDRVKWVNEYIVLYFPLFCLAFLMWECWTQFVNESTHLIVLCLVRGNSTVFVWTGSENVWGNSTYNDWMLVCLLYYRNSPWLLVWFIKLKYFGNQGDFLVTEIKRSQASPRK